MSGYRYSLVKINSDGFELNTNNLEDVEFMLINWVCWDCLQELTNEEDMPAPLIEDRVSQLLFTTCGAEFMLIDEEGENGVMLDSVIPDLEGIE